MAIDAGEEDVESEGLSVERRHVNGLGVADFAVELDGVATSRNLEEAEGAEGAQRSATLNNSPEPRHAVTFDETPTYDEPPSFDEASSNGPGNDGLMADHPTSYAVGTNEPTIPEASVTTVAVEPLLDDPADIRIDHGDADSTFGDDMESETTTLRSHITAYRIENGRRYHAYKDGAYWGPNDDLQNEQLDIAHHLYTLMLNGALHLAPIGKHPQRVLDLGTGTGIWAIDFADQYPSAIVVGTDLSPTQPSWVPPNVKFEIEDFTEDWTFRPNDFDFIHLRSLYGSVPDWPRFYKKVYRHLKPGAWMEQLEISVGFHSDDGSVVPDSALARFGPLFREASIRFGKPLDIASKMKSQIDDIGFVNTVEKVWKVPIRGWAAEPRMKELGHWGLLELDVGLEGFAMALLTRVLGWKYTEVQAYLGQIRQELHSRDIHPYHYVHLVYGQKPDF